MTLIPIAVWQERMGVFFMTEKASNKLQSPLIKKEHALSLEERSKLFVSGVEDVLNFDEHMMTFNTLRGAMIIEGNSLHIHSLSLESGQVEVEGTVDAIFYEDRNEKVKRGFFSRLVH